jgi:hypothetical protein
VKISRGQIYTSGQIYHKKKISIKTWKLIIIEIAVPFGKKDQEEEDSNSLKKAIEFKTNKYAPLIKSIRAQFERRKVHNKRFTVEFIPIVVS